MSAKIKMQLAKELRAAWRVWGTLIGYELKKAGQDAIQQRSAALYDELRSEDGSMAAEAVLAALWGRGEPSAEWWRSPLGVLVGLALKREVAVTQQMAADILGVKRGTVGVLVRRGGDNGLAQVAAPRLRSAGRPAEVNRVALRSVLERLQRLAIVDELTDRTVPGATA